EGPWTDPEHHQQGRLYLEVRPGGAVAGWFSNASIAGSYQLAGRSEGDGTFTLTCACPVNQGFSVKATLRGRDGDLRGRLTCSARARSFSTRLRARRHDDDLRSRLLYDRRCSALQFAPP